jgi:hypothetical protein
MKKSVVRGGLKQRGNISEEDITYSHFIMENKSTITGTIGPVLCKWYQKYQKLMKYWLLLTLLVVLALRFGSGFYRSGIIRHFKFFCTERNNDEIQDIIEKVKQEDAEWLRSVFGDNFNEILAAGTTGKSSTSTVTNDVTSESKVDKVNAKINTSKTKISNNDENNDMNNEITKLIELGYTMKDALNIKPSVRQIVLERMVVKPKRGLPEEWLLRPSSSPTNKSKGTNKSKYSNDEAKTTKRKLPLDSSGVGESFKWRSSAAGSGEYKSMTPKSRKPSDSDPYYGDGSPVSFWPDIDEFKDMLLDESKWRVDVIGPWSAPLIRLETKWRYNLYRTWLQFLDEGIGDGFDEIPGAFVPDEDDDDDDRAAVRNYNEWINDMIKADDDWTDVKTAENEVKLTTNRYMEEESLNSMPSDEWFDDNRAEDSREYDRRPKNSRASKDYNDSDDV